MKIENKNWAMKFKDHVDWKDIFFKKFLFFNQPEQKQQKENIPIMFES